MTKPVYQGIWPVAPTPFGEDGVVDYEGMLRVLDCMIDQGVDVSHSCKFFRTVPHFRCGT